MWIWKPGSGKMNKCWHKGLLLILSALSSAVPSFSQMPSFDPASAAVISSPEMTVAHSLIHCIDTVGNVYFSWYEDDQARTESPDNMGSVMMLGRSNLCQPGDVERVALGTAGGRIGSFRQGPMAPYSPVVFLLGSQILYRYWAYVDGENLFCTMVYDRSRRKMQQSNTVCSFVHNGVVKDFTMENILAWLREQGLSIERRKGDELVMAFRMVPYEGYWYTTLSCFPNPEFRPVVLRTRDGVKFEPVFICREFAAGGAETDIERRGNAFYLFARSGRTKDKGVRGTYIAKYSPDGQCLVVPHRLGDIESKPAVIHFDGNLFAFYNVKPEVVVDGKSIRRSRLRISRLDMENLSVLESKDITSECGVNYPFVSSYKGSLYLSFSEDRKHINRHQSKSNVSFVKLRFDR